MNEPNWRPRITKCESVYFLDSDGGLEEEDNDLYLALEDENGDQHRLQLSPDTALKLSELLALALQSPESPIRSPDRAN